MSRAVHSFTIAAPRDKAWNCLSNFILWRQFLFIPDAKEMGWGNQFALKGSPGIGTRLDMYCDDDLQQEWAIEQWEPPNRLKIASRVFHGLFFLAAKSSIEASVTPVAGGQTQVELDFSWEFTAPVFGYLLHLFFPVQKGLKDILMRFENGFKAALTASP